MFTLNRSGKIRRSTPSFTKPAPQRHELLAERELPKGPRPKRTLTSNHRPYRAIASAPQR